MPEWPVYLDNHATTRTDPRVVESMLPYFTECYGNPGSTGHAFGWRAEEAVDEAREAVAALIGAEPREVVFTSGATESNNLAFKGLLPGLRARGNHVVTTAVEHRSVLDALKKLGRDGWELSVLPCDEHGMVSVAGVAAALTDRTVLVSVIAASNEVGTINPLAEIGQLCESRGVVFHTDATQAVGKIPFTVREWAVGLLSFSGHKLYGPKGIGALYVRRTGRNPVRLNPLFDGGGQERGLRSGTVPVPLVVGLGTACALAAACRDAEAKRVGSLRDRLQEGLTSGLKGLRVNGHPVLRLPGNLNVTVNGVDGDPLMMAMTGVAVSAGAACNANQAEPSHVLRAIGLDDRSAKASLRFGLGRFTTAEEVDFAVSFVTRVVDRLRGVSAARLETPSGLGIDAPV